MQNTASIAYSGLPNQMGHPHQQVQIVGQQPQFAGQRSNMPQAVRQQQMAQAQQRQMQLQAQGQKQMSAQNFQLVQQQQQQAVVNQQKQQQQQHLQQQSQHQIHSVAQSPHQMLYASPQNRPPQSTSHPQQPPHLFVATNPAQTANGYPDNQTPLHTSYSAEDMGQAMRVPPGMVLQRTGEGRVIVVPASLPGSAEVSDPQREQLVAQQQQMAQHYHQQQQQIQLEAQRQQQERQQFQFQQQQQQQQQRFQPGQARPISRMQPASSLGPGVQNLGPALSQVPLEHPATGVGGVQRPQTQEGAMMDAQTYNAHLTRQAQQQQQEQFQLQQQMQLQQQQQRQQQELRARELQARQMNGARVGEEVQTFQHHPNATPVRPEPRMDEAKLQRMRETQVRQMREVQLRQQQQMQQQQQQQQQQQASQLVQGFPGVQETQQVNGVQPGAMQERERLAMIAMQQSSDRQALITQRQQQEEIRLHQQRLQAQHQAAVNSTPGGPPSEPAETAFSVQSRANSQSGAAIRLAQQQLQAGLGMGMPGRQEQSRPAERQPPGYLPPRAVSLVNQAGPAVSGTGDGTAGAFAIPGPPSSSSEAGQQEVGQDVVAMGRASQASNAMSHQSGQMHPSGISIGLEDERGVIIGLEEDQGMLVHPSMTFGQATLKMLHFFEKLKQASETGIFMALQILIQEHFLESAVLDLTLHGSDIKHFDLPFYLLPRFFHVTRDPRTVRTGWNMANPLETYLEDAELPPPIADGSPQGVALESSSLSWSQYFSNGAVVITHGACRAIWTLDPSDGVLKMHRLELALRANDDLVFRSAIQVTQQTPARTLQLQVRTDQMDDAETSTSFQQMKTDMQQENNASRNIPGFTAKVEPLDRSPSSVEDDPFVDRSVQGGGLNDPDKMIHSTPGGRTNQSEAGDMAVEDMSMHLSHQRPTYPRPLKVDIPLNPLDQFGMNTQSLRFLDLASTFLSMMPLIELSEREKISPKVALRQHVARDRVGINRQSRSCEDLKPTPGMNLLRGPATGYAGESMDVSASIHSNGTALSVQTSNLTPTPMYTSAFTTTPLSAHPPGTPHSQSTPNGPSFNSAPTPQMIGENSLPPPSPAQNGTTAQQYNLKRKLERSCMNEDGILELMDSNMPAKRVAPSPRSSIHSNHVHTADQG